MENKREMACTIFLVAANVIVFFWLSFGGMTEDGWYMLQHGAMYTPYFMNQKEYYRIFTSIFLHFGFQHLINNMLSLVILGRYLEPVVGKVRFLIIYILSGLAGNLLSLAGDVITGEYAVSAGASGAVFGITGALLSLTILNRGRILGITKQGVMIMIAVSLYNGFASEGVDNLAHIGGLLCGFLVTFLLCFQGNQKRRSYSL